MLKKIGFYFLVVSAVFMVGCNDSNGEQVKKKIPKAGKQASTVDGMNDVFKKAKVKKLATESNDTIENIDSLESEEEACESGSIEILESKPVQIKAKQCKNEDTMINGDVSFDMDGNDFFVHADSKVTIKDSDNTIVIDKNSKITYDFDDNIQDIEKESIAIDFSSIINGQVLKLDDLDIDIYSGNCNFVPDPKADCMEQERYVFHKGSIEMGKNKFTIDTSKKNEMVISEMGPKKGGVVHMTDAVGHKVELAVEGDDAKPRDNYLVLKIDEDGDGKFQASEIIDLRKYVD